MAVGCWLSSFSSQFLSRIRELENFFCEALRGLRKRGALALGSWLLALSSWLLALGYWLLALGFWLLALGSQLLALSSWLLALNLQPSALLLPYAPL